MQAQAVLYPLGWVRRTMQFALPRILGMFLLGVWAIYRIARGWLRLKDGEAMPQE